MKITSKDVKEWMECLELAEDLKPVLKNTIEKLVGFGPELKTVFSALCGGMADLRIEIVQKFEDAGFSREEAIYLTMDEWWGFRRLSSEKKEKRKK